MYVGGLGSVSARFPEQRIQLTFKRGEVRFIPKDVAALFTPSRDWVIGVHNGLVSHDGGPINLLVRRAVALGDVLCVHGAIQGIMEADPGRYRVTFQVAEQYVPVFKAHPLYEQVVSTKRSVHTITGINHMVCLDNILEWDHRLDGDKISRVQRTWRTFFMGKTGMVPEKLAPSWHLTIPERDRAWAYRTLDAKGLLDGRPLACVAARAIQKPRNLKDGLVKKACDALVAAGIDVLLIEPDPNHIWKAPGVHGFPRTDVLQAMALMHHADALCTMDSGAMWMGHCVPIPTVVWFGPTPPETKINYHPYYENGGVVSIQLHEWIGCPEVCYEAAKWCDWTYRCLKAPDEARFVKETVEAVEYLVEWKHERTNQAV